MAAKDNAQQEVERQFHKSSNLMHERVELFRAWLTCRKCDQTNLHPATVPVGTFGNKIDTHLVGLHCRVYCKYTAALFRCIQCYELWQYRVQTGKRFCTKLNLNHGTHTRHTVGASSDWKLFSFAPHHTILAQ